MSERQPIGDVLDNLGIRVRLDDGDLIAGAVVLVKILDTDGNTRLHLADSEGLGWLERRGMLHVGLAIDGSDDQANANEA